MEQQPLQPVRSEGEVETQSEEKKASQVVEPIETSEENLAGHEQLVTDLPAIYVASLSDYTAGRLHGRWIKVGEIEDMWVQINQLLAGSPEARATGLMAEEFAIHDFEHFGVYRPGEYESIETISEIARGIREHGLAFSAWVELVGVELAVESPEQFGDWYLGDWPSLLDFAEQLVDDMGLEQELDHLASSLRSYISVDYEQLCRDLHTDLFVIAHSEGVWLFDANQ